MSDLSCMLCQVFHFCTISCIVKGDVAFCISDDHSFAEEVEVKSGYFMWTYLHVYFLDISVEGTPHFDLVASRRKEA
jgi:hypothetical protein